MKDASLKYYRDNIPVFFNNIGNNAIFIGQYIFMDRNCFYLCLLKSMKICMCVCEYIALSCSITYMPSYYLHLCLTSHLSWRFLMEKTNKDLYISRAAFKNKYRGSYS